jgi:hypothetical protein
MEGLQAVWQAGKARARTAGSGKSERTQPAPKRRHKRERQRRRACGRACGPHNAGRLRATQFGAHANVRTDRWERRDRSWEEGHHAPH